MPLCSVHVPAKEVGFVAVVNVGVNCALWNEKLRRLDRQKRNDG